MELYTRVRKIISPILKSIFRVHIHGIENLPDDGTVLVCPNHISNWDPILVAISADRRQIRYMAKAELFRIPLVKQFLCAIGTFPIKRGEGDVAALKKTIKLLGAGEAVGMFPQGTRHIGKDPAKTEIKYGVGLVAYRSKADVVPVAVKTKKNRILPFRRVDIVFGEVIKNDELGFTDGKREEFVTAADKIFSEILSLLSGEYR